MRLPSDVDGRGAHRAHRQRHLQPHILLETSSCFSVGPLSTARSRIRPPPDDHVTDVLTLDGFLRCPVCIAACVMLKAITANASVKVKGTAVSATSDTNEVTVVECDTSYNDREATDTQ